MRYDQDFSRFRDDYVSVTPFLFVLESRYLFFLFFFPPQMGQFYYAAKAFDVLERLDPNPEYWEGKRGACVGIFQQIIAGHEPRSVLNVFVCLWELQVLESHA